MPDRSPEDRPRRPVWRRRASVTTRILTFNIIALALLAGSLFYLDSYRRQLLAERFRLARTEAQIAADALAVSAPKERTALIIKIAQDQHLRLRIYDRENRLTADSFALAAPTFQFIDPKTEPWYQHAARALDRGTDFLLGALPLADYAEPSGIWPEVAAAWDSAAPVIRHRLAPDRTPVISAAAQIPLQNSVLLTTRNATDITQSIRDARQTLVIVVGIALLISIQLSLFLARTIVQPLRELVRAAVRVRLGRDRQVVVPRLPDRGDEIGLLARAISDMTSALRQRIDAVESFAADVAHEIKNPLASLRSALETLEKVDDPDLRRQLSAIAAHDVQRIDRLVTEIADASRIDAELSRTTFSSVNLAELTQSLVNARNHSGVNGKCVIEISHDQKTDWTVSGDAPRLQRVLENLLDNAVSFSPSGTAIELHFTREEELISLSVADHGPGISPDAREKVFERFHSLRPASEDFGRHSGLGLAIARTIIEAHDGTLTVQNRKDGQAGTVLMIELPAWEDQAWEEEE